MFLHEIFSETATKIFATKCFFTDHSIHKTVNKANFRAPSSKPPQLHMPISWIDI